MPIQASSRYPARAVRTVSVARAAAATATAFSPRGLTGAPLPGGSFNWGADRRSSVRGSKPVLLNLGGRPVLFNLWGGPMQCSQNPQSWAPTGAPPSEALRFVNFKQKP